MFLGHFAVGLAAKPVAPRMRLPVLLAAPLALDIVWPVLVASGIERAHVEKGHLAASPLVLEHMPYSHSLLAAGVWALVFAIGYGAITRDRRGAVVAAALVVSHWVLDWIAHEPDLPLWPGSERYGLGLWRSLPGTMVTEAIMFAIGAWLYTRATAATGRWGRIGWPVLAAVLVGGWIAGTLGEPPPSIAAMTATMGVSIVVVLAFAWAIERQRPAGVARSLARTTRVRQ